jgi:hypothetical protein
MVIESPLVRAELNVFILAEHKVGVADANMPMFRAMYF